MVKIGIILILMVLCLKIHGLQAVTMLRKMERWHVLNGLKMANIMWMKMESVPAGKERAADEKTEIVTSPEDIITDEKEERKI